jgi:hypothetical protein
MAARIKLGELLVRAGVLDDFKLKAALAEQHRWGGRLGRILVEMNFVTEDLLVKALSKQLDIPRAHFDSASVPRDVAAKIDATFCSNNAICPERYIADKKTLVVAMADPTNVGAVDELRFKTGLRIETSLAGELEITQAIDRILYGREPIDGLDLSSGSTAPAAPLAHAAPPPVPPQHADLRNSATPMSSSSIMTGPVMTGPMMTGAVSAPIPPPVPGAPHTPITGDLRPGNHAVQPPTDGRMMLPPFDPRLGGTIDLRTFPPVPQLASPGPNHSFPPPMLMQSAASTMPPGVRSPGGTTALEMAVALDAAQRKQLKAIRVMLELLIEKGVFTRDEYIQLVNKR